MTAAENIRAIHTSYCKATGTDPRDLPLNMQRETLIGYWITYGKTSRGEPWGVQDLLYVISLIKKGISNGSRQPGALRFNNLFGQLDTFEEDLAEAMKRLRAAQREKPRTVEATQQVGEIRRTVEVPATPQPEPVGDSTDRFMQQYRERQARRAAQQQAQQQKPGGASR